MPDEPQLQSQSIRGIDWKSAFPFTLIFRSFRVAIHPSKLVLALVGLLLIYIGGRVMDGVWFSDYLAVPNELTIYSASRAESNPSQAFYAERAETRREVLAAARVEAEKSGNPSASESQIKAAILKDREVAVSAARANFDTAPKNNSEETDRAVAARDQAIAIAYAAASQRWAVVKSADGFGLAQTFLTFQLSQMHKVVQVARQGNWLSRGGMFDEFMNLLTVGPGWALRHHWFYFTVFGVYSLLLWAIFGGAVARIAAVQVTRDERISFRQALSFSTAKFLSFVSAPIIPLLIILVVGLVVTIGAFLLFNIPFLGPILGGALFFLALAAGFVMTLVLIGLLGGINLMYPTIAVEGSDSFDAISRSFSYLFARPWRLVFYSFVAAIYGTLCYVFVRYFIRLMLGITWTFASLWILRAAGDSETIPLWSTMWPNPLGRATLSYPIDDLSLSFAQATGSYLLAFWVYLTIAILGAFAISFYLSANTIIYVLMRHEVDATELDDVYLEQPDEDFVETSVTTTVTTVTTDTAANAVENAPNSEGQSEQPNA